MEANVNMVVENLGPCNQPSKRQVVMMHAVGAREIFRIEGKLLTQIRIDEILCIQFRSILVPAYRIAAVDWYGGDELKYLERCQRKDESSGLSVKDPRVIDWAWHMTDKWVSGHGLLSGKIIRKMGVFAKMDQTDEEAVRGRAAFLKFFNWRPT